MADVNITVSSDLAQVARDIKTVKLQTNDMANSAARDFHRLKMSVDPVYAATITFTQKVGDLKRAQSAGIITQSQYSKTFKLIQEQASRAGVTLNNLGKVTEVNTKIFRRFGAVGMQQVGYQVQDFFVQVQGGTSVLVALGQQGSQLASIFGPKGAIAGAVLAIGTGLAGAFIAAGKAAREAKGEFQTVKEAMKEVADAASNAAENIILMATGFETMGQFTLTQEIKALNKELKGVNDQIEEIKNNPLEIDPTNPLMSSSTLSGIVSDTTIDQEARLKYLEAERDRLQEHLALLDLRLYKEKAIGWFKEGQKNVEEAEAQAREDRVALWEESLQRARELKAEIMGHTYEQEKARDAARQMWEETEKNYNLWQKLGEKIGSAEAELLRLAGVPISEKVAEAVEESDLLRDYLTKAVQAGESFSAVDFASTIAAGLAPAERLANLIASILGNITAMGRLAGEVSMNARRGSALRGEAAAEGSMGTVGATEGEIWKLFNGDPFASTKKGGGGGGGSTETLDEYLSRLEEEITYKRSLIGLTDEQVQLENKRREIMDWVKDSDIELTAAEQERINALMESETALMRATAAEQQRKQLMDSISGHIENAFMAIVDGSMSVEEAFKTMIRNIILDIYKQMFLKPILGSIFDTIMGGVPMFGGVPFSKGSAFAFGMPINKYGTGDLFNSPTMFPMGSRVGMLGENGPEAIMPLKRGAGGKLGVVAEQSDKNVTVNQYFNISANGDESVKRIVRQEAPRIAEQAKAAVLDSKRRGGSFARAF